MLLAQLFTQGFFIFIFEVKGGARENRVFLDHFIEDVNVEWKSLSTFKLLDQFSANWASDTVLVVQLLDAIRTESMPAVHKYARNAFPDVVLESAELADVELARLVVQIHDVNVHRPVR